MGTNIMDKLEIALTVACVFVLMVVITLVAKGFSDGFLGEYQAAPIISYYTKYGGDDTDRIVCGLHYTSWCGYCKVMKPVWEQVKSALAGNNVLLIENDEDTNPQTWVKGYPTIVRLYHGKIQEYKGPANFEQLKAFIMNPSNQDWW